MGKGKPSAKVPKLSSAARPSYKSNGAKKNSLPAPTGNHVIVMRYPQLGVLSAFVRKPRSTNGAFLVPHLTLNKDEGGSLYDEAEIFTDYNRRASPDESVPMLQDPDKDYYYTQFVRILETSEDCTPENAKTWGEHVAKTFSAAASRCEGYNYGVPKFVFVADLTPEEDVPLCHDFLDDDVLEVMREIYPPDTYSSESIANSPDIVKMFFGEREDAKNLILTRVRTDADM
jgi:hypothetical protein